MNKTDIDWAEYSWNPVTGCLHGCEYCYGARIAEGRAKRFYPKGYAPDYHVARLAQPAAVLEPARIFVCSMGDLFGDWVPAEWINAVLRVERDLPRHTFIHLTKNPKRYSRYDLPANAWAGVTVDGLASGPITKAVALEDCNAPVRFISLEPLLAKVTPEALDAVHNRVGLGWLIIGQQTGPKAKPADRDNVAELIDWADDVGVPVLLKGNLKWRADRQEYPAKTGLVGATAADQAAAEGRLL